MSMSGIQSPHLLPEGRQPVLLSLLAASPRLTPKHSSWVLERDLWPGFPHSLSALQVWPGSHPTLSLIFLNPRMKWTVKTSLAGLYPCEALDLDACVQNTTSLTQGAAGGQQALLPPHRC